MTPESEGGTCGGTASYLTEDLPFKQDLLQRITCSEQQSVPHRDCQPAFAMTRHTAAITPALVKEQRDAAGGSSLGTDTQTPCRAGTRDPGLGTDGEHTRIPQKAVTHSVAPRAHPPETSPPWFSTQHPRTSRSRAEAVIQGTELSCSQGISNR